MFCVDFVCHQTEDYTRGAFGLSHVCQRWKFVALDYSPLWSHIVIGLGNLDYLEECLTRSKGSSLRVRLDIREEHEGEPSAAVMEALEVLLGHGERITAVDIRFPHSFDYRLLTILTRPLPNLQKFRYSSRIQILYFQGLSLAFESWN
jgi:hypothetical protein